MAKVTAKVGKDGTPVEVDYPLLDCKTIEEAVKNFGEDVVLAHVKSSITVALQGNLRTMIKAEKSQEEIDEAVAKWKPGMRTPGKTKLEKVHDLMGDMTPEQRAELLKKLKADAKG